MHMNRIFSFAKRAGRRTALLSLLALYFALALIYSVAIPAWESPDEVAHVQYIVDLRANRSLPRQQIGVPGATVFCGY